ncbi:WYL domain-containing protein [Synergistaceae bacterium OttesenSCG-928-D05]|nr:WYL domain-containing protein [Synergistaceae bacterium OttesenSCG-928-D05]
MPRDLSSVRLERLNTMINLLRSKRGYSKQELMDRLEIGCNRTFERDMELLRDRFHVEVHYDTSKKKYYCTDTGMLELHLSLTQEEMTAVAAGLKMAAHFLPHLQHGSDTSWDKIKQFVPAGILHEGEKLSSAAVVSLPVSPLDSHVFQQLIDFINLKQPAKVTYASPYKGNEPKKRTLFPWGVYFQSHAWYLWAASPEHPEGATWRVSRVLSCEPANAEWLAPPPDVTVEQYAGTAWFASPGELKYDITLHLFPPLSHIVAETQWHPTQKIEEQADGSIIYTAKVPDLEEVARWAMSCAPHIKVVGPKELVTRVEGLATSFYNK